MRDRPTDWLGGVAAILLLSAAIILPQLAWWIVTGEPMNPDVAP